MLSFLKNQTFHPSAHEDWNEEIDTILERNFRIAAVLTVCLNTFFGVINFYLDTFGGLFDFGLRLISSAVIAALFLFRDRLPFSIRVKVALPLSVLILQDAFILSRLPEEEYLNYSLAHAANFVGAALFIIWPPRFSVVFWSLIAAMHVVFFTMFSESSAAMILSNGGWLLVGVFCLTITFIHIRYTGLKNMIRVRRELERNNEWMLVQHGIIESKSSELQRSNQRLKEFAYMVSHDLKAPLRGINNIVGWLEEDCGKQIDSTGKSHLELLRKQVVKMEQLIASVLEYSKAENSRRGSEWIDLDELVNDLVETVGTDGKTVFCLKIGVARMQGTRVVVNQVLQNLVTNSIKHNNKPQGKVEVEIRDLGEMLCFSVTDNGPGIAPAMSDKIFDMYTTTGSIDGYTNTGIGLSVAKKLVEESGGSLWLDHGIKDGTRFCFTLPHAS